MFDPQKMVAEFHRLTGHPAPTIATLEGFRAKLRADLILEEALEFCVAAGFVIGHYEDPDDNGKVKLELVQHGLPNWPEMIDALCDLAYVTFGAAVEMGVDLAPFFLEVHRTNLAKKGGGTRADGKGLKPEGWKPPQIAAMLSDLLDRQQRCRDAVKGQKNR